MEIINAVKDQDVNKLKDLLNSRYPINTVDSSGQTALMMACRNYRKQTDNGYDSDSSLCEYEDYSYLEMIQLLLKVGCN
jgi:ankyrin repeat protein